MLAQSQRDGPVVPIGPDVSERVVRSRALGHLKLRCLSVSEFQSAIFLGFSYSYSYSYSALAVLVLENTASRKKYRIEYEYHFIEYEYEYERSRHRATPKARAAGWAYGRKRRSKRKSYRVGHVGCQSSTADASHPVLSGLYLEWP
jgi:hypothetical protein